MDKIFSLSRNDLKNIFREQILLTVFTFFPLLSLVASIWLIPMLGESYPEVVPYYPVLLTFIILQVSVAIGFIFASIFLDEKDAHLLPVLRTIPLKASAFLAYRLVFGMIYMLAFSLLVISTTPLITVGIGETFIMALLFTLPAPIITLAMGTLAQNKVEGLAIFKGIDFTMLLPSVAFFVPNA